MPDTRGTFTYLLYINMLPPVNEALCLRRLGHSQHVTICERVLTLRIVHQRKKQRVDRASPISL